MSNEEVIKDTVDRLASEIKTFQEKHNENGEKMNTELQKLSDSIADNVQTINDLKAEKEAQAQIVEEQGKELEVLARINSRMKTGEDIDAAKEKVFGEMKQYLRKGIPMSDESIEYLAEKYVVKTYTGEPDSFLNAKKMEVKALMVGNDPNGGYLVIPERSSKLIKRIFETSPIRQVANVMPIGSNSVELIIDDNEFSSGGWVSEIGARANTANAELGKLEIYAHEQFAQPRSTQSFLDDPSIDVESWILSKLGDKLRRVENTAFITGDGAGKPKGILSYAAWAVNGTYERGKVEQINSGLLGSFTADSFIDLQGSVIENYQTNAVWLMKRSTFTDVMKLKDGVGQYLLNPQMLFQSADKILLGKNVIFADDMPAIANNSLPVVYGDLKEGYTIADRMDIRILRDPYTDKPYIKFYTTKRVGGAVTSYESFKIMKLAA